MSVDDFSLSESYPYLTRFERARIIAERAEELSRGAPPKASCILPEDDATRIAMRELLEKSLPLRVRRNFPDGSHQDCDLRALDVDPDNYITAFLFDEGSI